MISKKNNISPPKKKVSDITVDQCLQYLELLHLLLQNTILFVCVGSSQKMLQINLLEHHYTAFISTLSPFFDFNMFVLNFSKREILSWLVVPLFLKGQSTEISENTILNG